MHFAPESASPSSLLAVEPNVVMIVDDDPALTDGLTELLEDEGYVVVAARDGVDALEQLRAGLRPSVILLDLMMPRMDGWDFRQAQLRDADLRDIPIVVISAAGFSATSVKAQFGDIDFLPKPPDEGTLLGVLKRRCQ
jgi:CheY-like chemotaxis protein